MSKPTTPRRDDGEPRADIEAIEALLAKATPGPWRMADEGFEAIFSHDNLCVADAPPFTHPWSDGALIVALRNAAPALLAEVRALRALLRRASGCLTEHASSALVAEIDRALRASPRAGDGKGGGA